MTDRQPTADELRDDIAKFSESVGQLAGDAVGHVNRISKFSHRTRAIAWGLVISLLLDLGITGYLWATNQRISAVQERTSDEVLCPLYGLIVSGYHPELRPAGPARAEYVKDYRVILDGYKALGCVPVKGVTPGPTVSPSPRPGSETPSKTPSPVRS